VLNQADHIATGRATLDAVRDAANRWVYPEPGLEPWKGVREVWAAGSPQPRHGVDITETFDRGVGWLRAHAAYVEGLGLDRQSVRTSRSPPFGSGDPDHHRRPGHPRRQRPDRHAIVSRDARCQG
jgi:LmbE family N-acetylglucosaminyl deacetylase